MKKASLRRSFFYILLIVLLGLFAYSNTFRASFQFDDIPIIVNGHIIKDLKLFVEPTKAKDFKGQFEYETFKNRYIGYLTFALNYRLHGLDVAGYHIVNFTIHIINAVLVYWFVILTFKIPFLSYQPSAISYQDNTEDKKIRRWEDKNFSTSQPLNFSTSIALFSALIFVSHPVHTQSVTYIWQRVASLATLFYLLSVVMYIKFRIHDTRERKAYIVHHES
ncbi:MAG: hypothetical protein HY754_07440 [Nitrospirae bacterium]|nr:hypothetical protein [Nitrospirota bacterium]